MRARVTNSALTPLILGHFKNFVAQRISANR